MTDDMRLLVGSLSNDLFRVATLTQRGSHQTAAKFLIEAKRWAQPLTSMNVANYVKDIAKDVDKTETDVISLAMAEKYLMYGVILQNYALHNS